MTPSNRSTVSVTRRTFVWIGTVASAAIATGCASLKHGNWEFLSDDEASTLTVICDQIIPADDFPSASQAGVLSYIDRQLIRHYRQFQVVYRAGLERADQLSRRSFGGNLTQLNPSQQVEIVRSLERVDPMFFGHVREHTLEGYYGSPRHGGNLEAVSWRMLGLTEPPVRGRAERGAKAGLTS